METRIGVREHAMRFLRRRFFDNRRFWNDRYTQDPDKGSGPGSRGEFLHLKNELIRSAIAESRSKTILDIGCGDIAVLSSIDIQHYVGVDISEVVVKRNKNARPEWNFVCEDLTGSFIPESAELVLCLDVLIHQKSSSDYFSVLSKSLAAAEKMALISGYPKAYPGWNVFFHEPIGESVRRLCPRVRVSKVAEYQYSELLRVEK